MSPAVAALVAAGVAAAGWRLRWLTGGGAVAAVAVGAAVLSGGGLVGLALLGTFFLSGSALASRTGDRPRRTAAQVAANGWTAGVGGILILHDPTLGWALLGGGLAAAQADTWATEIGRHARRAPVLLTTGRPVATGTSGGVTWLGTLGGGLGAAMIAALSAAGGVAVAGAGWIVAAGVAGMFADSLLGATLQVRARCDVCGATVESRRHCDRITTPFRGWYWMTNDAVNAVGSGVGAAIALLGALVRAA
jgi:uncharacterized membrane protein